MQSAATSPLYHLVGFRPKLQTLSSKSQLCPLGTPFCRLGMASVSGFGVRPLRALGGASSSSSSAGDDDGFVTLIEYVGKEGLNVKDDLVVLLHHIQYACKRIAALVASPFNYSLSKQTGLASVGSDRDAPKPLDIVSVFFSLFGITKIEFFFLSFHVGLVETAFHCVSAQLDGICVVENERREKGFVLKLSVVLREEKKGVCALTDCYFIFFLSFSCVIAESAFHCVSVCSIGMEFVWL